MKHVYIFLLSVLFFVKVHSAEREVTDLPAIGPYFLCDERIIEDRWQIERFVVPLQRCPENPVLFKEHPWEGTGPHAGGSVLIDPRDGLFKMWYSVWNKQAYYNKERFSYNMCYAESQDGIFWVKPTIGVFNYNGDTENNCIKLGRNKTQNLDVEINPASTEPEDFFVAIHNDSGGVFVSTSTDGKTFDCSFSKPAVQYHSDTHNNFLYDDISDTWFMYVRPQAYAGSGLKGVGRRRIAVKKSEDLINWSPEYTVLVPEEGDPDYFYGMTVFKRGDVFFGALQHYEVVTHHLDSELVWSYDGYRWNRLPIHSQKYFLKHGSSGAWDAGMVFISDKPVLVKDEMYFYYGGSDTPHNISGNYAVGFATTPKDRLFGMRSIPGQKSRFLTRPIKIDGHLWLNAHAKGQIRVQVRTVTDEPIEGWTEKDCTPFTGNELAGLLQWGKKSLDQLSGQTVRLRFLLDNAEMYTFDIHE